MAKSKLVQANEKIAEGVVRGRCQKAPCPGTGSQGTLSKSEEAIHSIQKYGRCNP